MILVDANLLLYAKFADFPQHEAARVWLESRLNRPGRVGIPWASSLTFIRLATNPRLFAHPLRIDAAWEQVVEWLNRSQVWIPGPTDRHAAVLGELLVTSQATGNLVPDAHIAAIAIEHGLTICSADADFARFAEVDWVNPLAKGRRNPASDDPRKR